MAFRGMFLIFRPMWIISLFKISQYTSRIFCIKTLRLITADTFCDLELLDCLLTELPVDLCQLLVSHCLTVLDLLNFINYFVSLLPPVPGFLMTLVNF